MSIQYLSRKVTFDGYDVLAVVHRHDGVIVLTTTRVLVCMGNLNIDHAMSKHLPHERVIDTYNKYVARYGTKIASAVALVDAAAYISTKTTCSDDRTWFDTIRVHYAQQSNASAVEEPPQLAQPNIVFKWTNGASNHCDSRHHQYHVSHRHVVCVTPREDIVHYRMLSDATKSRLALIAIALQAQCSIPDIVKYVLLRVLDVYRC